MPLADPTCLYAIAPESSWLRFTDDSLAGVGMTRDDHLTAELALHLSGKGWTATLYDQMQTDHYLGERTDQGSATVGRLFSSQGFTLDAEAGMMADGNLGGAQVQNRFHAIHGTHPVDQAYRRTDYQPIAVLSGAWTYGYAQIGAVGSVSRTIAKLEPAVAIGGAHARLSVGWLLAWGREPSHVAQRVDANQHGLQVTLGGTVDHVAMSLSLSGRATLWSLGVVF